MIVVPGTKIVGDHWDADLGLYLDVEAQYQLDMFWWEHDPMLYAALIGARKIEGIDIEDHLPRNVLREKGFQ